MKLDNLNKDELRKKIVEFLSKVPDGQRVKMDKEVLESLLFEVIVLNNDIKLKLPIWSGEFLRKIDLSQVDFTDVSWGVLNHDSDNFRVEFADVGSIDESINDKIRDAISKKNEEFSNLSSFFIVDYSETNANIDLSKSFEAIHNGVIDIVNCNFNGVDFSQHSLEGIKIIYIIDSSVKGIKISIPDNVKIHGYCSSLEEVDLSSRMLDAERYFEDDVYDVKSTFFSCNLRNTGINICLDTAMVKRNGWEEYLNIAMNNDWIGCYVNGKKVLSFEEKQENASQKRAEYEQVKNDIECIEEQTNHMKR